jgi:NADH dehydrogenase [ubiquinone] 1 alpha subcomplex assembly factor 3
MNPPSPQLLRALRTSVSYRPTPRSRPSILLTSRLPSCPTPTPLSHLSPRRYNSNEIRSSRMVPRAHTNKPTSADRGPADENQTDINSLNVLGTAPPPTTAIDACLGTGFQFNNGIEVRNGDGVLLVGGEAFAWRPWLSGSTDAGSGPGTRTDEAKAGMVNRRGQFEVDELVWGLLGVLWPRPGKLSIYLSSVLAC